MGPGDWIAAVAFGGVVATTCGCVLWQLLAELVAKVPWVPYTAGVLVWGWFCVVFLVRLPLRPTWRQLERWQSKRATRIAPVLFPAVVILTNYFPTTVIEAVYSSRIFCTYIATVFLIAFHVLVVRFKPRGHAGTASHEGWLQTVARYLATLCAWTGGLVSVLLLASLVPATLAHRPDHWWTPLVPWEWEWAEEEQ